MSNHDASAPRAAFDSTELCTAPRHSPIEPRCKCPALTAAYQRGWKDAPELDRQQVERLLAANAALKKERESLRATLDEEYRIRCECVFAPDNEPTALQTFPGTDESQECDWHKALRAERDAANRRVAELEAALLRSCSKCHGRGTFTPHCWKCEDSGNDHDDCPDDQPCDHTELIRATLTPPSEPKPTNPLRNLLAGKPTGLPAPDTDVFASTPDEPAPKPSGAGRAPAKEPDDYEPHGGGANLDG